MFPMSLVALLCMRRYKYTTAHFSPVTYQGQFLCRRTRSGSEATVWPSAVPLEAAYGCNDVYHFLVLLCT